MPAWLCASCYWLLVEPSVARQRQLLRCLQTLQHICNHCNNQGDRLSIKQHLLEDHPAHHQGPLLLSCFCLSGQAAWPSAAEMPALLLCFAGLAPAGLTVYRFGISLCRRGGTMPASTESITRLGRTSGMRPASERIEMAHTGA